MPHFIEAPPLSLYVHLPWCVRKCPYCDFNSHALRGEMDAEGYVDALLRDLAFEAPSVGERPITSVFFGGGTPSLFPAEAIGRFLGGMRERLVVSADAEITLEANPGTVEQDRFRGFREAGVNRLSIGIQSFDDQQLKRLGRIHGRTEALRAAEAARGAGFDNFNLDLMYALPRQSLEQALEDLEQAIALRPAHISHYQLTLEPGTAFEARPPQLPEDDAVYGMQDACQARLAAAGYQHYEVSAYARPDQRCRHNLNYWLFGDYLAVGAGGHGKITDPARGTVTRRSKLKLPRAYQKAAGSPAALAEQRQLQASDLVLEFMMNALRLTEGFERDLMSRRTGLPERAFAHMLSEAEDRGWLEVDAQHVRPTAAGQVFLNDLLQIFLPEQP